ncbi:MAG: hypothetical protein QCI82_06690 [Candidatus Thermoplasmatota archaeon]|nr:hypothetical protein [Candidatus Thermoplasmatota archaeon]
MAEYYLDLETTGLDPRTHRLISIQYQRLDMRTGRQLGPLTVLKEWESSERGMLELFLPIFMGSGPFSFVAIGFNVPFMYSFIIERAMAVGLDAPDPLYVFGSKPYLDIKPFAVLMNNGSFKGASLDRFTDLSFTGEMVPVLYERGENDRIEECIKEKASAFLSLYRHLKEAAPAMAPERKAAVKQSVLEV